MISFCLDQEEEEEEGEGYLDIVPDTNPEDVNEKQPALSRSVCVCVFDHNRGLLYHGAFCAEKPQFSSHSSFFLARGSCLVLLGPLTMKTH